jgi:hypothetical protein
VVQFGSMMCWNDDRMRAAHGVDLEVTKGVIRFEGLKRARCKEGEIKAKSGKKTEKGATYLATSNYKRFGQRTIGTITRNRHETLWARRAQLGGK